MKKRLNTLLFLIAAFWFVGCHSSSTSEQQAAGTETPSASASTANPLDDKGLVRCNPFNLDLFNLSSQRKVRLFSTKNVRHVIELKAVI